MLDKNLTGWLHRRRRSAQIGRRAWLITVGIVLTLTLLGDPQGNSLMFASVCCGLLTLLWMVVNSALSLREERETGALELLLVTSLTTSEVILGRWRALAGHYRPAWLLVLTGFWIGLRLNDWLRNNVQFSDDEFLLFFFMHAGALSAWLTVPFAGLYFSLALRNAFAALVATGVLGLAAPWLLLPLAAYGCEMVHELAPGLGFLVPRPFGWDDELALSVWGSLGCLLQLTVGLVCWRRLQRGLDQRTLART